MSRTIPSTLLTALTSGSADLYLALDLDFDTAPVRLWTGIGDRTIDGNTYTGAGDLLKISMVTESSDLSARGLEVILNGANTSLISYALTENYQYRRCTLYLGEMGVTDVAEIFSGLVNTVEPEDHGDTATITLRAESKLLMLSRPRPRRYTDEDQQAEYPGDTFFAWVSEIQDIRLPFGMKDE